MNWFKHKFPFFKQLDHKDCGPSCLRMISAFHGRHYRIETLRDKAGIQKDGVSLFGISKAAKSIGLKNMSVKTDLEMLIREKPLPCILHVKDSHFLVLYKVEKDVCYVADPGIGRLKYSKERLAEVWLGKKETRKTEGFALLLEPDDSFLDKDAESQKVSFRFFINYFKPYKKLLFQVLLGLLFGSLLSLLMPILTQILIDKGVMRQNLRFVYLVLIGQLMIFFGKTIIEFVRSWLLLHVSTRVDISIISEFLKKLMKLPISFFDSKNIGDILQRIRDHGRVKMFLTGASLQTVFSMLNLILLSFILLYYSEQVFVIFIIGSLGYVAWIALFLKKRKEIDYQRFHHSAINQSNEIQLIQGMQEIKLNSAEGQKRLEWENIQVDLYKVNMKSLLLEQYQNSGSGFINELKNILITFWAAQQVIDGDMTLGMMMAISQIVGQMNAPIAQFISFIRQGQDAKISLERLNEIHGRPDEDDRSDYDAIPQGKDIHIKDLSFSYSGDSQNNVLEKIDLTIPYGKTTAIVGKSGSGKTTLLKLLLKFYEPQSGSIEVGNTDIRDIKSADWRARCGVVMQDGYIFSDTIAKNIAITDEKIEPDLLQKAAAIANLDSFISGLATKYDTKVGHDGIGLSQGQKQRLLIARATFKNPELMLFDEATSNLDSSNELEIHQKLKAHNANRTWVVIAHRLSTVRDANQIIVLDQGRIVEVGTHEELIKNQGQYHSLVKNQIDL